MTHLPISIMTAQTARRGAIGKLVAAVLKVREVFVQEVAVREETVVKAALRRAVVKAEVVEAEVGQATAVEATATCNEPSSVFAKYSSVQFKGVCTELYRC
jgi:hypothetical protein